MPSTKRLKDLNPETKALLGEVRSQKFVSSEVLDQLLAALDPASFQAQLELVVAALDSVPLHFEKRAPTPEKGAGTRAFPFSRSISRTYLKELEKYPPMDRETELRFARRMEFVSARLEAAEFAPRPVKMARHAEYHRVRSEFVERNLYLVVSHAYAYRTYGVPLDDLIQEGNQALMRAVEKFDWRHEVRFRTYVAYWIRQAIERYLASVKGIVRVPHHLQQKFRRLRREGRLPRRSDQEPTVQQVAEGFAMNRDAAEHLLEASRPSFSLDQEITKEGDSYRDFLVEDWEPEDGDREIQLRNRIKHLLGDLDERERRVLRMRFGLDGRRSLTLEEVGKALHLSRERSRQIQQSALGKLQKSSELRRLRDFL